jgi:hypothetical protein
MGFYEELVYAFPINTVEQLENRIEDVGHFEHLLYIINCTFFNFNIF